MADWVNAIAALLAALLAIAAWKRAGKAEDHHANLQRARIQLEQDQAADEILLGPLTTLSPTRRYPAAKELFDELLTRARAGDANAAGRIAAVARFYLEASRAMFASSTAYVADSDRIIRELAELRRNRVDNTA
jgi:hypothetical protein